MVLKKIFDQGIKKNINEIKGLLIVGIIFLGIYIFFKMIIFRGLKYSYSNKVIDIFNIKFGLEYMIYSIIIYISSLLVSLFFVPVLAPLLNYSKLNKKQKSLFFILSSLTTLSIIIVSYTISITENFGNEIPRIHFRYFTYVYIPFIILFYSIIENNCEKIKNYKKSLLWVIIFFTIILFFFKIPYDGSSVDYTVLNFVIDKKITLIKILSFLLIISFTYLFYFGKIKLFKILFFIIILFSEIKNIKIQIEKFNDRITTKKNVLNISEINNYVKKQKNKNFLIVNRGNDRNQKLLDTYLFSKNIYYITEDEYLSVQKNFIGIDLSKKKLKTYPNLNKVNYLIFANKTGKKFLQDDLEIKNIGIYSILKLKENYKLPELKKDFRTEQSVINLLETSKNTILDENGILMKPKGYIFGPYITLNKGEYKIELLGKNLTKLDNEFRIMSNGTILANKKINSDELIVNLKLNKETSGIEFILENNSSKEIIVNDIRILKKGE